jgi:antitoxin component HigA of HigAB toxin-antitoxin module
VDEAFRVLDRIQGWSRQLLPEEQDYLECLSDVASATGVALSTLSSVLGGKRKLNLGHIKALASYFKVEPGVFLD